VNDQIFDWLILYPITLRRSTMEQDDLFSSFSQLDIETKEKTIKTTVTELNKVPETRNDVTFEYLRGLEKDLSRLEKNIGKFISLPIFGGKESPYVPKDFDPKENFFLSEQRFEILKEVVAESSAGLLFVGPHGVGKSSLAYFVACYAWLNRFPLIYIVLTSFYLLFSQDVPFGVENYSMEKIPVHCFG
jgi:hypothetical protein